MTKEEMQTKIAARKAVAEQVIAMLDNNVLADNGFEQFRGWCEDGAVFDDQEPAVRKECIELMNKVGDSVDFVVWNCSTDDTHFGQELAAE